MYSYSAIQKDEKYFPNPLEFDPERFSAEKMSKINPYAYQPFGSGPRICIGKKNQLVLHTLWRDTINIFVISIRWAQKALFFDTYWQLFLAFLISSVSILLPTALRFVKLEIKICLAAVLSRFKFSRCHKTEMPVIINERAFFYTPKNAVWLSVEQI